MGHEIQSYRDLRIWQRGIGLVKEIYGITTKFPDNEIYGPVNQMRRCAVSIPSNIAEGQSRQHTGEFKQHLYVALGSTAELDTQLTIALELNYIKNNEFEKYETQIIELRKMIRALIKKLPRKN